MDGTVGAEAAVNPVVHFSNGAKKLGFEALGLRKLSHFGESVNTHYTI